MASLGALKASAPDTAGLDEALYRAYLDLGRQQLDQGLLDDSYASYGEALKLRSDDPAALDGQKQVVLTKLWQTMEAAWDQDEAVATAALEEILALDPGYRDANVKLYALLVTRANRMLEAGEVDGALAVLHRAQEVYPEGEEARALLEAHTPPPPAPEPEPQPAPAQNQAPPQNQAPAARSQAGAEAGHQAVRSRPRCRGCRRSRGSRRCRAHNRRWLGSRYTRQDRSRGRGRGGPACLRMRSRRSHGIPRCWTGPRSG